jgi:uncharacterized protein
MRVAIIGAGSAGLVTAHLLDAVHEVTVFERDAVVGGHVRTLGRNVSCERAPGVILDAGVVEFERGNFPTVMALFDELGCELREVPGTTTFWTERGKHHLSPGTMRRHPDHLPSRLRELLELLRMRVREERFNRRTALPEPVLDSMTLGELLTDNDMDRWCAGLMTYAYSIPYERVRQMPAALTVPTLQAFERAEGWVSLVGGSFDYLARILDRFSGTLHTNASPRSVARDDAGVTVTMASGEALRFDAVVFAAPPDQTLALLADPSDAEWQRFAAWRGNHIHTIVHRDRSLYARRSVTVMTEFDVIETSPTTGGYNCYLNTICGLPQDEAHAYGLAFGVDELLHPNEVLHRQEHHTPDYTVEAYQHRQQVSETNGERHTFHVGAWLGDGLQQGAIASAEAVAKQLGGRAIGG